MIRTITPAERRQLAAYATVIVALHVLGWGLLWFLVAPRYPFMLGFAGLAYSFGLRHAFDADHIAAIDNTTRKLMESAQRPLGVGFFFSLGHSTVVFVMTAAIALAAEVIGPRLPWLHDVGSLIGTTLSGLFLYAIGVINLIVLINVSRVFAAVRRGERDPNANADAAADADADANVHAAPRARAFEAIDAHLNQRGWMNRWFGRLTRMVSRPAQMYWVGLLFGLGFDTATEVALLATAGVAATQSLPVWAVMTLPIVFAAGMTLLDSADGVMMCGAYGWAISHPLRKLHYNLTITGLSVLVALFVGTIELTAIVTDRLLGLHDGLWGRIQHLDLQTMGYAVAGLFMLSWVVSLAVWRFGRLEERWTRG